MLLKGRVPRLILLALALLSLLLFFIPGTGAPSPIPFADKVVHFTIFALLAAFTFLSTPRAWSVPRRASPLALVAIYAPLTELVQGFLIPGRTSSFGDMAADLVGIAVGSAAAASAESRPVADSYTEAK